MISQSISNIVGQSEKKCLLHLLENRTKQEEGSKKGEKQKIIHKLHYLISKNFIYINYEQNLLK